MQTLARRLALVGLLLLAAGLAGWAAQGWLTERDLRLHPAPGQLVAVGGARLHLRCTGAGGPPVILEAGLSGWSQDWSAVQPLLAAKRQVCSYDRAGYGWSDARSAPHTGVAAVEDLRAVLDAAGVPAPRVLVGHSLGGLLAQLYAQRHPSEVAGLVLVDSLQRDQTALMPEERRRAYLTRMGLITAGAAAAAQVGVTRAAGLTVSLVIQRLPPGEQAAARALGGRPSAFRSLRDEFAGVDAALATLRSGGRAPVGAVRVIGTYAVRDFPPGWEAPEMRRLWIDGQRRLGAEFGVEPRLVPGAGHYLQLERPALVAQAVDQVVAAAERR